MFLHESQYLEPVMRDMEKFLESSQRNVTGTVEIELRPYSYTLIGVDLICNKQLVQSDLCERDILERMEERETRLIITPTGGQGFLLGRGNQQLSPAVMRRIGKERLATQEKLFRFHGSPLLVDTGDREVDELLSGYARVIIGYMEEQICPIGVGG
jgi:predicted polyphosphate/ATP-dependent NAD kinase